MGHDITATIKGKKKEASYIRIGAFNSNKSFFLYDALESKEMNGGVSGIGDTKNFSIEEIKLAKAKFNYMIGEDNDEVENLITENTKDSVSEMKNVLESLFGVEIPTNIKSISQEEKDMISEDINRFFDDIIKTDKEVEIYFG
jgi:esterase/lipase